MKKRKCDGARPACTTCLKLATREGNQPECTYILHTKKRGPQKGYQSKLLTRLNQLESILKQGPAQQSSQAETPVITQPSPPLLETHQSPPSSSVSPASALSSGSPDTHSDSTSLTGLPNGYANPNPNQCDNPAPPLQVSPTNVSASVVDQLQNMPSWTPMTNAASVSPAAPMANLPPIDANQMNNLMQGLDNNIWSWTGDEPVPFSAIFDDALLASLPAATPPTNATTLRESLITSAMLYISHLGVILTDLIRPNDPTETPLTLAACAVGASFSCHPELLAKYGTREQAVHVFVLRCEEALLNRKADTVETVLAMLMMAGTAYSLDQGWKAHKWIAEAHLTCECHLFNCTNIQQLTIRSLLKDPTAKPTPLTPQQREYRRMAWTASIMYATYCAMASGLPAGIEESDYIELLYERRPWEDEMGRREREEKRRCSMETLLPIRNSIFDDYCGAQQGFRDFSIRTSVGDTRLLQICFLIRRVLRMINRSRVDGMGGEEDEGLLRGSGAVMSVLGGVGDERLVHDALVEWHGSLPLDERVFGSLG
ncbi:hypothetical protein HDV00_006659, partial [Rhizophlyctis rosea]